MKKRRCQENKWDFTEKDDAGVFPILIHKGGTPYGFCPAKATWDGEVTMLFKTLHIAAVTGTMWEPGALKDQPVWWVDLLSWFIQRYDAENFSSKARSILVDGGSGSSAKTQGAKRNGSLARKPGG